VRTVSLRFAGGIFVAAFSSLLIAGTARADPSGVRWNPDWPRFRPSEYALTAGLAFNVAEVVFLYPAPQTNWEGGILFDDAVRDALVLSSRDGRATAAKVSDDIYYALAAYPLLVDTALVTWGLHGASDVAFQMMLINFESYALTGAVALAAEKVGRVRPVGSECAKNPGYDDKCGNQGNLNASFLSGHTTIAFAGAGLMCAHHTHLPLYGGRVADIFACAAGLAAATTAGVLRVMSDNHYASDVLLGSGVGLFGGYVWPALWHYGFGSKAGATSFLPQIHATHGGLAVSGALLPQIGPTAIGVTLAVDVSPTAAASTYPADQ
jgi:membrane-associated phospholipid phosphatase